MNRGHARAEGKLLVSGPQEHRPHVAGGGRVGARRNGVVPEGGRRPNGGATVMVQYGVVFFIIDGAEDRAERELLAGLAGGTAEDIGPVFVVLGWRREKVSSFDFNRIHDLE